MVRRRGSPAPLSALLPRWLRRSGLEEELRPFRLALRWPEVVGRRVASRTEPAQLREGVLTVRVANSTWLNELSFMRELIARRANEVLACQAVDEVRLTVGRIARRNEPARPRPERRAPASSQPAQLDAAIAAARRAHDRCRDGDDD